MYIYTYIYVYIFIINLYIYIYNKTIYIYGRFHVLCITVGTHFLSLAPYHFFTNIAINKSIAQKDCY